MRKVVKITLNKKMEETTNKKILLVDDDSFIRAMFKKGLEKAGFSVDEAEDVGSGLEKIKSGNFNLVVSDMVLPDATGIDLLKKVRSQGQFANLPIVILSSLSQPEKIKEATAAGANKYIIKDQTAPKDLIHIVEELTKG